MKSLSINEPPALDRAGKKIRVLIADDSATFRGIAARFLASLPGLESPSPAADGPAALTLAAGHPFDLVVLDLQMPDLNGLETMDRIRPLLPDARVVIFTVHDTEAVRAECLARGADGFVSKNRLREELPALIARLFPANNHHSP